MATPSIMKSGLLFLGLITLSSCLATPKEGDATLAFYQLKAKAATNATTGVGAFGDTFYVFARANCASCHGATQAPLFATGDVNSSYSAANDVAFVSFAYPSSSKLAVYSGNGHCGLPGCQAKAEEATTQIQAWADVENAIAAGTMGSGSGSGTGSSTPPVGGGPSTGGVGASSIVTTSLAIPANLPSGTTYVPMRWQLSQLTPANALTTGAIFELEVQKLSATTYRVRNPKIAGLKSLVKVTGIHVFVKPSTDTGIGVEDLGAGSVWENDVVNVAASTLPATLPTTPLSTTTFPVLDPYSMVIGIRSNQDVFTIAFDKIESTAALTATFASINTNILQTKCVSCHSTNNKLGGYSYSNYTDTRASVTPGAPGTSRLFLSTSGTNPTMPTGSLKLSTAETNAISTWITNGAQNN